MSALYPELACCRDAYWLGHDHGWLRGRDAALTGLELEDAHRAAQHREFQAQMRTLARTEATKNHGPAWADLVAGGGDAA